MTKQPTSLLRQSMFLFGLLFAFLGFVNIAYTLLANEPLDPIHVGVAAFGVLLVCIGLITENRRDDE